MIGIEELRLTIDMHKLMNVVSCVFLILIVLNVKVGHNITGEAILNQIIRIVYW